MTVRLGIANIIKWLEVKVVLSVKTLSSVPVVAGRKMSGKMGGFLSVSGEFYTCGRSNGSMECYNLNTGLKNKQSGFVLNTAGSILAFLPVFLVAFYCYVPD